MPVIEGRCPRTGDLLRVETAGDRIASVQRARTADTTIPWLVPGFIDVQVNGYAGHDVNGEGATPDAVQAWRIGDRMFIRTSALVISPQPLAREYTTGGVGIFAIPASPVVLASAQGRTFSLSLSGPER